jgi:hypothetical protein
MKLTIAKEVIYIPAWRDNKEISPSEQIVAKLRNPTLAMKEKLEARTSAKAISDVSGNIDHMEIGIEMNDDLIIRDMLISLTNCSYDDGAGTEVQVQNAKELLAAPVQFRGLKADIVKKCKKLLEQDVDEKNFE